MRQIALLWQTRPLRRERLYVADEVEIALSYLRDVFLPVLPDAVCAMGARARATARRASCGSAAGSAATATAIRTSPPNRCGSRSAARREAVLGDYLEQVHALGAELSISTELAEVTPAVARAGRGLRRRRSGAQRRALSPRAERHLRAAGRDLTATHRPARRRARRPSPARALSWPGGVPRTDLARAWRRRSGELDGGGALGRLIRAVETSASISPRSTCGRMPSARARGRRTAQGAPASRRTIWRWTKTSGSRCCARELAGARLLASPFADYSDETASRAGDRPRRRRGACAIRPGGITTYIISKAESVSDLLEVNMLLKEAGL